VNYCLSQLHEGLPTEALFERAQQALALLAPFAAKVCIMATLLSVLSNSYSGLYSSFY
jgi:hypothetical protein